MSDVFDEIVNLPKRFTLSDIYTCRPDEERMKLDDPMAGVYFDLRANVRDGVVTDERERAAFSSVRVAEHYFDNVTLLLTFILDDLQEYREGKKRGWPERLRLPLDLEKMLTDTRSMLDALYRLALLYQPDAERVGKDEKRRTSFGSFMDWYERQIPGPFAPPLGLLVEVRPWAQDIRRLRDRYVHYGHESFIFYGDTELYLDPSAHRKPPRPRVLPDLFYEPSDPNTNNLIVLEKFLVFIVAPILAVRRKLGDCIYEKLGTLAGWRNLGVGMPFREGPGIFRMCEWLKRNSDVLEPKVFKQRHFSSEDHGSHANNSETIFFEPSRGRGRETGV
jgi:hypothetical protein